MLLAIVKEFENAQKRLSIDPYAAWAVAARRVRDDWEKGVRASVAQLRDYLTDVPANQRSEAVQDLIAEHLRLAWRDGCGTLLDPYLAEFGRDFECLAELNGVPAELVEDEFLARYAQPHGDSPTVAEYRDRFDGRPAVMELLEQRCLDGARYVKLRQCGQGAMGIVFEAYDHHLRRLVAIKEPRANLLKDDDILRQFAEEAHVTAGLEHPAIVSVHEFHDDQGMPYYVMRLAQGRSFYEQIRDYHSPATARSACDSRLLWNQLLRTYAAICEAMAYAHRCGVLHRDLKPGNVIVGEFGETSLLDWGMAKRVPIAAARPTNGQAGHARPSNGQGRSGDPRATDSVISPPAVGDGIVVGTPQYMPPEQTFGVSDERSDVFGLGAILYEIMTGGSPHAWPEGFRPADWIQKVRDAKFPRPLSLKPGLPRDLEAICRKALSCVPGDRYASADDLASDIRRHLAGEPVAALGGRSLGAKWLRWVPRLSSSRQSSSFDP